MGCCSSSSASPIESSVSTPKTQQIPRTTGLASTGGQTTTPPPPKPAPLPQHTTKPSITVNPRQEHKQTEEIAESYQDQLQHYRKTQAVAYAMTDTANLPAPASTLALGGGPAGRIATGQADGLVSFETCEPSSSELEHTPPQHLLTHQEAPPEVPPHTSQSQRSCTAEAKENCSSLLVPPTSPNNDGLYFDSREPRMIDPAEIILEPNEDDVRAARLKRFATGGST
eukprot:TRINITY_DN18385_c0_g1_i1.p1 TRINITY_DN18385_c0_g1~~TRINITY_DN18385_c0_g1_i1.p1  ORF type:complete len:227 (-),score=21.94 TRINITY_DN18385_c0_g1_i1:128-808(-)